ncbi:MAG: AI-2E family transporter [Oscillospiraceae bacterium]|jgi:predicted PurR-regulated permease PerM|nr:AI-2E family transporter [Oscillospiraceae bacterium]
MEISRTALRKLMLLITFAILLYTGLQHLSQVLGFFRFVGGVVSPLLIGGATAFVLNVPMAFFEKKLFTPPPGGGRQRRGPSPKAARILSLLLTLLAAAVIIPVLVLIIVPQLAESVSGLGSTIMYACSRFAVWAEKQFAAYPEIYSWLESLTVDWESLLASAVDFVRSGFGNVVSSTISATKSIVSAVSAVFVAAVFAVYVLLQKEKLGLQCRKSLYALLPEQIAGKIVEICRLSHRVFSSFITGQCIEAVILGAMFFIVMTVLRMPYALLVGCLIAVTALIPIVGAFIGCAVGAFLLLMVSPMQALAFVVMFLALQQVEGNLIYPHVVGSSVGLPSIWVLAAVSVGGSLMGVAGMLLFIPLTSVLYTLFREFVYKRLQEKGLKVR